MRVLTEKAAACHHCPPARSAFRGPASARDRRCDHEPAATELAGGGADGGGPGPGWSLGLGRQARSPWLASRPADAPGWSSPSQIQVEKRQPRARPRGQTRPLLARPLQKKAAGRHPRHGDDDSSSSLASAACECAGPRPGPNITKISRLAILRPEFLSPLLHHHALTSCFVQPMWRVVGSLPLCVCVTTNNR